MNEASCELSCELGHELGYKLSFWGSTCESASELIALWTHQLIFYISKTTSLKKISKKTSLKTGNLPGGVEFTKALNDEVSSG